MISITTQKKQFELRVQFSFAGLERMWRTISMLFDFSQVREIEKKKQEMLRDAGYDNWFI